jgi:phosphatidylglycerol:prolipoprotein diacylglycerol transferase
MLPYFEIPPLRLGSSEVSVSFLLWMGAILAGHFLFLRRAGRAGLDRAWAAEMNACAVAAGMVVGHLSTLLYRPEVTSAVAGNPLLLARLLAGEASFGIGTGGAAAVAIYAKWRRMSLDTALRFVDAGVFVFPLAWILARLGCALAHDHPGRWTESWLGVQYPGGARWDLGVCELLYTFAIAGLFFLMDRKRRLPGTYLGLFLCLYGPFRFAVSSLRVDPVRYGGWTVDQYAGAAVAVAGLVSFHLRSRAGRVSGLRLDRSPRGPL